MTAYSLYCHSFCSCLGNFSETCCAFNIILKSRACGKLTSQRSFLV
uniref:Uncharacterized protein n=1 Tax=Anguilla anguilla TaxID=7936 RepID=A0A0E9RVY4_ANGAN